MGRLQARVEEGHRATTRVGREQAAWSGPMREGNEEGRAWSGESQAGQCGPWPGRREGKEEGTGPPAARRGRGAEQAKGRRKREGQLGRAWEGEEQAKGGKRGPPGQNERGVFLLFPNPFSFLNSKQFQI